VHGLNVTYIVITDKEFIAKRYAAAGQDLNREGGNRGSSRRAFSRNKQNPQALIVPRQLFLYNQETLVCIFIYYKEKKKNNSSPKSAVN
jgi:hypothetical protein